MMENCLTMHVSVIFYIKLFTYNFAHFSACASKFYKCIFYMENCNILFQYVVCKPYEFKYIRTLIVVVEIKLSK